MGWQVGVAVDLGSLWRQRGAAAAPDVDIRRPLRTVVALFRSKWWTIGYAAAAVAWLLHIGALAIAPLSIVQASLAAGFVFLALLADRFFGFDIGLREWVGVALASAGLAFLALSAGHVHGSQSKYGLPSMITFEAAMIGVGALLIVSARQDQVMGDRTGVLLGAGAGALFTVTHVALKALTHGFNSPLDLVSAWTPLVVAGGVIAFFASARSLQIGPAVPVIAVTSIVGNATAIAAGVVVVVVAALLPGPIHARGERRARRAASPGSQRPAQAGA